MTNKKIIVQSKEELKKDLLSTVSKISSDIQTRIAIGNVAKEVELEVIAKLKEINRRKTRRLNARLNLVACRMGYTSWSNFGKQFSENLIPLEGKGTEAQVNAVVKVILMRSLKAVMRGSDEIDQELQDLLKAHPRIRENWRKRATRK